MSRPLSELVLRATGALVRVSSELRASSVKIAREKSPSSAFDLASRAAVVAGLSQLDALAVAKATRWLAVIRRDHGLDKFEKAVRTLAATHGHGRMATPKEKT